VDTFIALQKQYDPVAVGVEEMQVSKSILPFMREEMVRTGVYINLHMLKHGGKDKPSRSKSMQARMRAKGVKFAKEEDWYASFEDELLTFPRGRKDDQADAFAYVGMMLDKLIEAPSKQERTEEEYLNDLEESGLNMEGRSEYTGY
jgi:phage terminase large subunit-like protein